LAIFPNLKYLKTYASVLRDNQKINSPSQKSKKHQKSDLLSEIGFLELVFGKIIFFESPYAFFLMKSQSPTPLFTKEFPPFEKVG
jgi:hypothetical protein